MGIFTAWQAAYAERGVITFPVVDKRPAVSHYLKAGRRASRQWALKFPAIDALGFACGRRNGITVLDIDSPDERLLADALDRHGSSPLIVRSGSGNHHVWYRNNGEGRRIRPDPSKPIDVLGGGFVVAPPSEVTKGRYEFVQGSLDDLDRLPTMRAVAAGPEKLETAAPTSGERIPVGQRADALWRHCMKAASRCTGITELMEIAVKANQDLFYEPLPDAEVLNVVASAWAKELAGENWFGRGERVILGNGEVDGLLSESPDAFLLLAKLRRHHWGRNFVIANAMADDMPGGGWRRQRLAAARQHLDIAGYIEEVRPASRHHGPAVYRFPVSAAQSARVARFAHQ